MALLQATAFGDRLPTPIEQDDAARLKRIMDATRSRSGGYRFAITGSDKGDPQEVHVDAALGDALRGFLEIVSKGQAVQIVPIEAELSTKQAAQLLNVSRPFLIKLLDQEQIEFRRVGRHRRVKASDLFDYKQKQDGYRNDELARMLKDDEEEEQI
ncbi:helix-turn-helix domain-containing protein [Sulfitobacter sp. 1A12126]|uniref:helix-turn-helix domain-containing protein n=1 Tax=Sulfitobacter sp. 1A12126 TaxID=3368591 RepID=UPI0037473F21